LDSRFKSYGVLKISIEVWACSQPLPMQQNLPKIVKNCQNLPKNNFLEELWNTTKSWDFGVFLLKKIICVEKAPKHMPTIWIFITRISQMPFLLSKNDLCMWISSYPFVQNDVFFKVPYVLWVWDFVDMYLTHLQTRIWNPSSYIYSKKWFFWPPKNYCIPWAHGSFLFFSTLIIMLLQMVRNESVWFGKHVDL
jgi:hypothetical protein